MFELIQVISIHLQLVCRLRLYHSKWFSGTKSFGSGGKKMHILQANYRYSIEGRSEASIC